MVVAYWTSLSQMCGGKAGLALVRPEIKWSFQVPIAFSAGLDRWSCGAISWKMIFFLVVKVARLGGHSLSRNWTVGAKPRLTRES